MRGNNGVQTSHSGGSHGSPGGSGSLLEMDSSKDKINSSWMKVDSDSVVPAKDSRNSV